MLNEARAFTNSVVACASNSPKAFTVKVAVAAGNIGPA